ncbi:lipopolysaccharide-induced tumor necrosis factor-alpha factor homolog [Acropora muricata]|uniref:lipopolysaccharide-induced tumor necrosis factor-alpha factor homolog n=1 Tax=Acropora muricata TaxID=159855 RepID=UPI0034E3AB8D
MADPGKPPPYNYGAIPTDSGNQPPPPYPATVGFQGAGKPENYMPPPTHPYPQPQPYQCPPQPATTTTIIAQPAQTVFLNMVFGESPVSMVCPHCQTHIITCTTYQDGTLTWLASGALCLLGCWAGCCLIPFCLDGCKDVIHSCPNCHSRLGCFRRM